MISFLVPVKIHFKLFVIESFTCSYPAIIVKVFNRNLHSFRQCAGISGQLGRFYRRYTDFVDGNILISSLLWSMSSSLVINIIIISTSIHTISTIIAPIIVLSVHTFILFIIYISLSTISIMNKYTKLISLGLGIINATTVLVLSNIYTSTSSPFLVILGESFYLLNRQIL